MDYFAKENIVQNCFVKRDGVLVSSSRGLTRMYHDIIFVFCGEIPKISRVRASSSTYLGLQ